MIHVQCVRENALRTRLRGSQATAIHLRSIGRTYAVIGRSYATTTTDYTTLTILLLLTYFPSDSDSVRTPITLNFINSLLIYSLCNNRCALRVGRWSSAIARNESVEDDGA